MPELTQSLWAIEQGWATLLSDREDILAEVNNPLNPETEAVAIARLIEIDEAIVAHAKAEVRKVDGVRGVWKHLQMLHSAAMEESRLQAARAKSIEANLNALKSAVQVTMEEMPWREGKPRKLEGRNGALYLKGNGGRRAVTITDESMVPDEFCKVYLTINAEEWESLKGVMRSMVPEHDRADDAEIQQRYGIRREPSISRIYDALTARCPACEGCGVKEIWARYPDKVDRACDACGGSGTAGVPGAYLATLGSHVECK